MGKKQSTAAQLAKKINPLVTGLQAAAPAGVTSLGILGQNFLIPDLITKLGTFQTPINGVVKAEVALATAHEGLDGVVVDAAAFIDATRGSVKGALGPRSALLGGYGMTAAKVPRQLTVAEQAAKVEKMLATRAARHTMGPKQKAAIKGAPPAPPATPPATPPAKPGP